jgi:hypothetical protein
MEEYILRAWFSLEASIGLELDELLNALPFLTTKKFPPIETNVML